MRELRLADGRIGRIVIRVGNLSRPSTVLAHRRIRSAGADPRDGATVVSINDRIAGHVIVTYLT